MREGRASDAVGRFLEEIALIERAERRKAELFRQLRRWRAWRRPPAWYVRLCRNPSDGGR
jgi:hypothetical protein